MPSRGRVAVPLADGFDDDEFETVRERLREAGYQMHVISGAASTELVGRNHHFRVPVDRAATDVRARDYVGLVLIHAGPYGLEDVPGLTDFIAAFERFERPTLSFASSSFASSSNIEQACWAFIDRLERGITDSRSAALPRAATTTDPIGPSVDFPWNVL